MSPSSATVATLRLRRARVGDLDALSPGLRAAAQPDPALDAPALDALALDADHDDLWLVEAARDGGGFGPALGCVRVRRGIGLRQPRYWYHVGCAVRVAAELGLHHRDRMLSLGNDLTGASELAAITVDDALADAAARAAVLRLLLAGALRAAWRAHAADDAGGRRDPRVVVELPGVTAAGLSPFWHGLGRHFYPGDPAEARRRHGAQWRTHVAALLPQHPLVASLLDEHAQAALGAVPATAQPLRDALERAGLRAGAHVAIDDGGAVFEGDLDLLHARAGWQPHALQAAASNARADAQLWLLASGDADEVWWVAAQRDGDALLLPGDVLAAIGREAEAIPLHASD